MNRKIFASTFVLFLVTFINAQNKVFEKVELEANTDKKTWASHINKHTQLPDSISKNITPGIYTVTVQFIVDIHGSLGQIKSLNDPGYGLATRAVNAISSYKGEWKPATQCGRNVKAYRKHDVVFIVSVQ